MASTTFPPNKLTKNFFEDDLLPVMKIQELWIAMEEQIILTIQRAGILVGQDIVRHHANPGNNEPGVNTTQFVTFHRSRSRCTTLRLIETATPPSLFGQAINTETTENERERERETRLGLNG